MANYNQQPRTILLYDITLGSFFRSILLAGCNWNLEPPVKRNNKCFLSQASIWPESFRCCCQERNYFQFAPIVWSISTNWFSPEKKPKKLEFHLKKRAWPQFETEPILRNDFIQYISSSSKTCCPFIKHFKYFWMINYKIQTLNLSRSSTMQNIRNQSRSTFNEGMRGDFKFKSNTNKQHIHKLLLTLCVKFVWRSSANWLFSAHSKSSLHPQICFSIPWWLSRPVSLFV